MIATDVFRIAGGVLVLLIGIALGAGGLQLWRGGPAAWPDVIANETTVRRTSGGMIALAVLLLVVGVAAAGNFAWGGSAAAIATIAVVAAAFWVNYLLFGNFRLMHTGTNVVVATIILALLYFGYSGQTR